ncbi:MAG: hypothetical protein AAF527_08445 [Pseudomonadota bacterium]
MKYLAIVLASVASLAATAQAYLLWQEKDNDPRNTISNRRIQNCRSITKSASEVSVIFGNREYYLERYQTGPRRRLPAFGATSSETQGTVPQDEGLARAERALLRDVSRRISDLDDFVLFGPLYFTADELEDLNYQAVSDLHEQLSVSRYFGGSFSNNVDWKKLETGLDLLGSTIPRCKEILMKEIS